jgi:arylsulfatase
VTGAEITDAFIHWQDTQTDPWAACLNYMDAHTPYVSDPQYSIEATSEECYLAESINNYVWEFITETRPLTDLSLLEAPYNDCIRQVDAEVGRLIQELADHDVLEQTLVVVTADHGEGFGEPGTARSVPSIGHGGTGGPEEGVLRIPLVVKFPNQTESVIVEKPASLTRFPCVVRTVLNGDHDPLAFVPDGFALASGLGLSPSEMEAKPASVTASEYDQPFRAAYEWTEQDELRKHVVCGGAALSFDVTDPTDVRSIESVDTATIVQNAFEELEAVETLTDDPTDEIDPATEQRLEYLGYR